MYVCMCIYMEKERVRERGVSCSSYLQSPMCQHYRHGPPSLASIFAFKMRRTERKRLLRPKHK